MRKRHLLLTAFIAPLVFVSAHAQQSIKPSALVGKWQISAQHPSGAMINTSVELNEDLKFATESSANNRPFMVASGTWALTATKLEWRYERSSQPAIQPGYVDIDEVVAVSESELTLKSKLSGKTHTYIRSR
jgi:hypothetical protein